MGRPYQYVIPIRRRRVCVYLLALPFKTGQAFLLKGNFIVIVFCVVVRSIVIWIKTC